MQSETNLIVVAFKKPYASDACIELGKLFAMDNSGYDFQTIKKRIVYDDASIWLAIDRLKNDLHILETFPVIPKEKLEPGSKITIPYKFRVKSEYESQLKDLLNGN
jgi:hypothetical protein